MFLIQVKLNYNFHLFSFKLDQNESFTVSSNNILINENFFNLNKFCKIDNLIKQESNILVKEEYKLNRFVAFYVIQCNYNDRKERVKT